MAEKEHNYTTSIVWTGNNGEGTKTYTSYERSYTVSINGKKDLQCSSDAPFRGDTTKYNPEDLFLASISSCHMLWYLHLCSDNNIVVTEYKDNAVGKMIQTDAGGYFTEVTLFPSVTITDASKIDLANSLHQVANKHCFIANSLNFKVKHTPNCRFSEKKWFLYMLECADGTIYTGITTDIQERMDAHNSGKGAKYTRGRTPVVLKASFEYVNKSEAAKAEYAMKKLTKAEKMKKII